jgi:hypothetical protein
MVPLMALTARMGTINTVSDRMVEVTRLAGPGALVPGGPAARGLAWAVLADPESNEFRVPWL